jgi:hypothetical protein
VDETSASRGGPDRLRSPTVLRLLAGAAALLVVLAGTRRACRPRVRRSAWLGPERLASSDRIAFTGTGGVDVRRE